MTSLQQSDGARGAGGNAEDRREDIMKRSTRIFTATLVAVATLGTVGLSLAHPDGMGGGYGPGMWGGMGAGMGGGMGLMGMADATAVGGRLAAIKSELKITPAQETAWSAFEKQTLQQAQTMQALHQQMQEKMHGATPGTPQEFAALREGMFKARQANAETHAQAVKDLYVALTPEQRAVADRSLRGLAVGGGYGRGHGHGAGMQPGCGI